MKRLMLVLAGVLVAVSLSPAGAEPIKLAIGHSTIRNEIAALWVPKEAGIFARHGIDATSHLASVLLFRHFGLDLRRDRIALLAAGEEATRAQAVLTGRIDATIIDPSVAGPLREKGFSYLGNLETMSVPFINAALVTTRRYAKEQSKVVEGVIKAVLEGNAFILNPANRKAVTEILARHLRLDPDKADTTYKDLLPKVERKPYPPQEAVVSMLQVLAEGNPKIGQLKPDDLTDLSVLKRLDQEGFVDRLYQR